MEIPVKPNPTKVATKWAIIDTITGIVITYAIQLTNTPQDSAAKYLTYIPFIAFMFLAQKEFRDQQGGYMTFGAGFSTGFRYAVFSGLMIGVFTYLYFAILSPAVWGQIVDATRTKMEAQNNMSSEQIDKAMDITRKWGPIFGAFGVAVGSALVGAIISLIGAAIFKKELSPLEAAERAQDPNGMNS